MATKPSKQEFYINEDVLKKIRACPAERRYLRTFYDKNNRLIINEANFNRILKINKGWLMINANWFISRPAFQSLIGSDTKKKGKTIYNDCLRVRWKDFTAENVLPMILKAAEIYREGIANGDIRV